MSVPIYGLVNADHMDTRRRVTKMMQEMGFKSHIEFPEFINRLLDAVESRPLVKDCSAKDKVLESLAIISEENKDQRDWFELKQAYRIYSSFRFALSETHLTKFEYKKALLELGLTIRTGGGNKLKIYNILSIDSILEEENYL